MQSPTTRTRVRWHNDPDTPLEWAGDGQHHRLIALVRHIIHTATGQPPRAQIWAPNWYRSPDGLDHAEDTILR